MEDSWVFSDRCRVRGGAADRAPGRRPPYRRRGAIIMLGAPKIYAGGGCRARSKALDLGSSLEGVQGFESLPPHSNHETANSVRFRVAQLSREAQKGVRNPAQTDMRELLSLGTDARIIVGAKRRPLLCVFASNRAMWAGEHARCSVEQQLRDENNRIFEVDCAYNIYFIRQLVAPLISI